MYGKGREEKRKGVIGDVSWVFGWMILRFTEMEEGQILEAEQEIMSFLLEMRRLGLLARDTSQYLMR